MISSKDILVDENGKPSDVTDKVARQKSPQNMVKQNKIVTNSLSNSDVNFKDLKIKDFMKQ